jgi:hypothetical protein
MAFSDLVPVSIAAAARGSTHEQIARHHSRHFHAFLQQSSPPPISFRNAADRRLCVSRLWRRAILRTFGPYVTMNTYHGPLSDGVSRIAAQRNAPSVASLITRVGIKAQFRDATKSTCDQLRHVRPALESTYAMVCASIRCEHRVHSRIELDASWRTQSLSCEAITARPTPSPCADPWVPEYFDGHKLRRDRSVLHQLIMAVLGSPSRIFMSTMPVSSAVRTSTASLQLQR